MGIFDKISNAIFGKKAVAAEQPASTEAPVTAAPAASAPATPAAATPAAAAPATVAATSAPTAEVVDVAAIMDAAVAASGQKLKWRTSIVDMMKALGMESTLAERKELAAELNYTGDMHDSAAMNIWLHKALIAKLAANGGKVPADLLD